MSSNIPAEAPSPLPPLPTPQQVNALGEALRLGFESGRKSARAQKISALKARLNAMRLAPIPTNPKDAMARAREAARLAREAKGLGTDPETGLQSTAMTADISEARRLAHAAVTKARRGVKPGSREDKQLQDLENGLADDTAPLDLSV